MGGNQLVETLTDKSFEADKGDDVRDAEKKLYGELIDEVVPLEEARELIVDLKDKGHAVVLASSAKEDEVGHYLDLLDARAIVDAWTHSGDVEATKPEPDLIKAAIAEAGDRAAVLVGDSVWDCEAAKRAGIPTIAVLTGGFSRSELLGAGAAQVFDSVSELRSRLEETSLG
jgi:HAD superfamily hydrolase (TIGR01549 family)